MVAEHGVNTSQSVLVLLWDILKCFECVTHWILVREARLLMYPLHLLRVAIQAYKWPRVLKLDDLVSLPIYPKKGIIAGSMSATYELRCLLQRKVSEHCSRHPFVDINFHIDDVAQESVARNPALCIRQLKDSADELADVIQVELRLPLSSKQVILIGSDTWLPAMPKPS